MLKTNENSFIEIQNITYCYPPPRRVLAVNDISFSAKAGELIAVIGQNGSGKTTLAKCISGYLKIQSGKILIDGKEIFSVKRYRERAKLVGYIFQNPDHQLFKDTVWSDVAFGLKNIEVKGDILKSTVDDLLKRLELYRFKDIHPMRLSKGDRQRLAIACILAIRPKTIIIDEPTTGQDMRKGQEIMELLKEVSREQITILVITHSMELVAKYADRVIVMGKGKLLADGIPRKVFTQTKTLSKTFVLPPTICNLALALGLKPIPLTVEEAKNRFMEVLGS